jgi:hypothetical protein
MGELLQTTSGANGSLSLVSAVVSVVALGLFALFQNANGNNDDDDSTPGGGLMQPVA